MQNLSTENNYAFIDSQNLNLGVKALGWDLDFKKFRVYLKDKFGVTTAYLFLGFVPQNQSLYNNLQKYGYVIVFKPTIKDGNGKLKGNVDADLVLQTMIDINKFDKAIIVTSDGDFHCLVEYLFKNGKLKRVISPNQQKCSTILLKASRGNIDFVDNLKTKLEYKKRTP